MKAKIKQQALAADIGIATGTLNRIEMGHGSCQIAWARLIARRLDCSLEELVPQQVPGEVVDE